MKVQMITMIGGVGEGATYNVIFECETATGPNGGQVFVTFPCKSKLHAHSLATALQFCQVDPLVNEGMATLC